MLTTAQRRPFVVRFRNAINGNTEGRRFITEDQALTFAKNPANEPFNNTQVFVFEDPRDGLGVRPIYSFE